MGGISKKGAMACVIFEGRLESLGFQGILKQSLLPFIKNFSEGCRVYMDNDSKHVSRSTAKFFEENSIHHFKSPAQSPVGFF